MPRRPSKANSTSADLAVLSGWAPELAETFVALASDIALVLDEGGVVLSLVQRSDQPLLATDDWIGRPWSITASDDSRAKIAQMLADVAAVGIARKREVNHPQPAPAASVAMAYTAIRLGGQGPTLVVGHGLHAQAALQQRFLAAQAALEHSYWLANQRAPVRVSVAANAPMAAGERVQVARLPVHAAANAPDDATRPLLRALDDLRERIGRDALPGLVRDAKRLIEEHFLQRALDRAVAGPAHARKRVVAVPPLAPRPARKRSKPAVPRKPGSQ